MSRPVLNEKKMKAKRVEIVPGCISCGTCESLCPEVFEVREVAYVKPGVDPAKHSADVLEAAEMCPVSVIKVTTDDE